MYYKFNLAFRLKYFCCCAFINKVTMPTGIVNNNFTATKTKNDMVTLTKINQNILLFYIEKGVINILCLCTKFQLCVFLLSRSIPINKFFTPSDCVHC